MDGRNSKCQGKHFEAHEYSSRNEIEMSELEQIATQKYHDSFFFNQGFVIILSMLNLIATSLHKVSIIFCAGKLLKEHMA